MRLSFLSRRLDRHALRLALRRGRRAVRARRRATRARRSRNRSRRGLTCPAARRCRPHHQGCRARTRPHAPAPPGRPAPARHPRRPAPTATSAAPGAGHDIRGTRRRQGRRGARVGNGNRLPLPAARNSGTSLLPETAPAPYYRSPSSSGSTQMPAMTAPPPNEAPAPPYSWQPAASTPYANPPASQPYSIPPAAPEPYPGRKRRAGLSRAGLSRAGISGRPPAAAGVPPRRHRVATSPRGGGRSFPSLPPPWSQFP